MSRFHHFDPYKDDKERKAAESAKEMHLLYEQGRSASFAALIPEVKQRREIRANQTKRAKTRPVTTPKVWR